VIGGMTWFDCNERSSASSADRIVRFERCLDYDLLVCRFDDVGFQAYEAVGWGRAPKFDRELRRYRARRDFGRSALHQVPGCSPVRMTIEQRADDPSVQHARKCLVMGFGHPFGHNLARVDEATDSEPQGIGRATAEADASRRVCLLKALFTHQCKLG
jgi:hypothetical protein